MRAQQQPNEQTLRLFELVKAEREPNIDQVMRALEEGAEVNWACDDGRTPLYLAAQQGYTATALALIGRGAEVNRADNDGWTPLKEVLLAGHYEVITLLLVKGADPFLCRTSDMFESLEMMGVLNDEHMLGVSALTALAITKAVDIRTAEDGNPIIQIRKRTPGGDIVDANDEDAKLEADPEIPGHTPQITIPQNLRHATRLISQIAGNARTILSHPAQPAGEEPIELTQAKERFIASILTPPEGFDPAAPNAITDLNDIRTTAARLIAARGHSDLLLEALKRGPEHPEALPSIASGLLEVCSIERLDKAVFYNKRLSRAIDSFLSKSVAEEMRQGEAEDMMRKESEDVLAESGPTIIPTLPELGMIISIAYNREAASIFLENLRDRSGARELLATIEEAQEGAKECLSRFPHPRQAADAETTRVARRMVRYMAILEANSYLADKIPAEEVHQILELMPYVLDEVGDPAACEAARRKLNPPLVQLLQATARQYDERVRAGQDVKKVEKLAEAHASIERAADEAIQSVNLRATKLKYEALTGRAFEAEVPNIWDRVLADMADPQDDILRANIAAGPQGAAAAMEVGERPQVGALEPMEVDGPPAEPGRAAAAEAPGAAVADPQAVDPRKRVREGEPVYDPDGKRPRRDDGRS